MRIAYASDLHGEMNHYRGLFALAAEDNCDAVILGGDLSPKKFSKTKIIDFHRRFYEEQLFPLIEQAKNDRPDLQVYVIMGNDDCAPNAQVFEDSPLVHWIHGKVVELEPGLLLSGYSCVDITPFYLKDWERWDKPAPYKKLRNLKGVRSNHAERVLEDYHFGDEPHDTIEDDLVPFAEKLAGRDFIWVAHCPPYQSNLDKMAMKIHVGSEAVRSFIEEARPLVSLHGHIHESPRMTGSYTDEIGGTLSINAGQDFTHLHAVVFDTEKPRETLRHSRL